MYRLAFLIPALGLLAPPVEAESARELNSEGYRLYRQQRYPEALEKFRQAFQADAAHALAHYNFAATLGILRKQGKTCAFGAYASEILDHLERSIALDPRRRARALRDPDFDSIQDTVRFQKLLGKDPARVTDTRALLTRVRWLGTPQGAYGSTLWVRFGPRSQATVTRRHFAPARAPQDERVKATFAVLGREVVLTFPAPFEGHTSLRGRLDETGQLTFEAPLGPLKDEQPECDA